ncbi:cytochrome b5 [Uncinocarpus reesii 1704]|uniref:Cytochrome b5 n=1 Tax=Uncinocarpus reesii (strain UAMH 1704) TaxID=336963 RepID=C4JVA5_UNCRE|nr:cytochrome b5 [Uncinocarpus reesii 1704]EEP81632.1 cytochrome b5 [Uncinocarpus reesii 1704]
MSRTFTLRDVARHKTKDDVWLALHGKVYDVTKFLDEHPGGEDVILDKAGQDASAEFDDVGHSDEAREALEPLLVGTLEQQDGDTTLAPKPAPSRPLTAETTARRASGISNSPLVYLAGFLGSLFAIGVKSGDSLILLLRSAFTSCLVSKSRRFEDFGDRNKSTASRWAGMDI